MASIAKLSVRGVRAFSPEDEEQVISFCFPLTIIVGANGCGKTTIIESLKYAVTGSLPPGNKAGQAFVHDPKSIGQTTVKANIKLRFTNRAGNAMVVVRSMEVTQKKTNMTFKALDGILRTTDPNTGEKVSLSHKCTELDRQIPTLMGVSKPILEHVVFCHQEDSSWPLQEGAVLKKRFDDIFDSTRYAKALEAIRKTRLEYAGIVKDHKADLAGLASHKHAAEGFREEMDDAKTELARIDDSIQSTTEQIEEEQKEMERAGKVLSEIEGIRSQLEEKDQDREMGRAMAESLRESCDEDLTQSHTLEQLQSMESGFDNVVAQVREKKVNAERRYGDAQREIDRLNEQKLRLNSELGKLAAEREAHEKDLRMRQKRLESMGTTYGLELAMSQTQSTVGGGTYGGGMGTQQSAVSLGGTGRHSIGSVTTTGGGGRPSIGGMSTMSQETLVTISAEDMDAFQRAVDEKRQQLQEEKDEAHAANQKEVDALLERLSDLNAKHKTVENERIRIRRIIDDAKQELQSLKTTHTSMNRVRQSDIDAAKRNATKAAKESKSANEDPRMGVIPQEIRSHEDKIMSLKRSIEDDTAVLQVLRQHSEKHNTINMLQRQIEQDVENIDEIMKDNSYLFQKFNIDTNVVGYDDDNGFEDGLVGKHEKLAQSVSDRYESLKDEQSRANDDRTSAQQRLSEKSALLSHNQRTLTNLRAQVSALEADDRGPARFRRAVTDIRKYEMQNGYGGTVPTDVEPQALVEHLTSRIAEHSEEDDKPESISRTIKKLRKMAKRQDDRGNALGIICPCCDRDMSPEEAQVFMDKMKRLEDPDRSEIILGDQTRSEKNRASIRRFEAWRDDVSKCINDCLDYKRVSSEFEQLEAPVQNGEEEVNKLQKDLDEAEEKVKDLQSETSDLRQLVDISNRLRDDAIRVGEKKSEITTKEGELGAQVNTEGRDLETVERDLAENSRKKEDLMNQIGDLNRESSSLNARAKRASEAAAHAEKIVKKKEEQFAREQESTVRRNELNETVAKHQDEAKKLEDELIPLRRQVQAKESDLKRLRAAAKGDEDRLNENFSRFTQDAQRFDELNSKIEAYLDSNKPVQLERLNSDLAEIEDKITEKTRALKELQPEIAKHNKQINEQERHKKNIANNLKVFEQMANVEKLTKEIETIEEELGLIEGSDTSQREYDAASKRIRELEDSKARNQGRRSGVKEQVRNLKRKLHTEEYKDIDERHRECMIKYETTQIAVKDLEKYYKALDNALLRYHGMKIADINKIIRELWTLTYKGEDIQNIQLVSGQEGAAKTARSYNYRVVMTKGNTQLDMRGRCSAGQRVLASIVIRLALAETFCLNCGVMALDEPTTNLDYANKRGLAIALAQIISTRAVQSNFQLVVITHDEDFVSMMKNELAAHTGFNMPERYFQVCREEGSDGKHYSKIHCVDWDEI